MSAKHLHISREKVALLIFIVLMLIGTAFVCSYFFMGRQINTTATVVDEVTGNMQDYALVVFSGVGEAKKQDQTSVKEGSTGKDVYASGLGQDAATVLKERLADGYQRAKVKTSLWRNHVFVSDVREDYELKGADVATIDLSNLSKYSTPTIVDSGRRNFGVFSIRSYLSKGKLKSIVSSLKAKGADSVICVAKDVSMLSSYTGIDALISLKQLSKAHNYPSIGATLVVETPSKGNVGVLLFSDSNVTSYRTIKTL